MKKAIETTLCGVLAAVLVGMPLSVYANATAQNITAPTDQTVAQLIAATAGTELAIATQQDANATMLATAPTAQEETVFVKLRPDGAVDYSSVSKHLLNHAQSETLTDFTTLQNIENVNGFETYRVDGDRIIWQSQGNDIYYKGKTEQALPITVEITYKLNGETKALAEILGKSGRVEMQLHYQNSSKVGNLYTPFLVIMGTTLPTSARNIEITNGKVISNGRGFAVMALAAPGLYDSLQLNELQGLDDIILAYNTDDFALNDVYNIVTPKILDQSDLKIFDEVDKLTNSSKQLAESSQELVKGTQTLRDGVQELRNGIIKAQTQLQSTGSLIDEETLTQISDLAASAARKQIAAQQSTIRAQIHQQVSGMEELGQIQNSLVEQLAQAEALKVCLATPPVQSATSRVQGDSVNASDVQLDSDDAQQNSDGVQPNSSQQPTTTEGLIIGKCSDPAVLQQYVAKVKPVVAEKVASQFDLTAIEEKMFQSTYVSLRQVAATTAATTARNVAMQVARSIQDGLGDQLDILMSEMLNGIDQLLDGVNKLNDGMTKFDQEGIQTLNNLVNNKLKSTADKTKRLTQLAHDYNNFSGISKDGDGEVKFILMIDAQKK